MAYAALVSVAETLSQTLKHHQYGVFLDEKRRLQSLHEHMKFLRAFLEDFPDKAIDLEGRIRDAATEAEDIIEYQLFEEIRSSSSTGGTGGGGGRPRNVDRSSHRSGSSNSGRLQKMCQQLPKVSEAIESIVEEVMGIKNSLGAVQDPQLLTDSSESPPTTSSTALVPTKKYDKKDAMVGFEEDLLATKTRLCGGSCKLQFVPIYGMGDIGNNSS
ncbi:UNVERIFIED_CONTAM: hypothetical protein Slati_4290300 [Sesamum latifolium]|uniref:Uncharacterized protein n=1 Tax=Sesamum latifolium TaxID=2727402 RepID=A0AAW2TDR0_9LAMI